MWHYANYRGKELLVLGHSIRHNNCFVVDLAALPMNESVELRRIVQSTPAQQSDHLVTLLRTLVAPDHIQDWFSYLMIKSQQRNGPVFTLPLKEIQDSIDEDQRAIFKGYGKGRRNKYLDQIQETLENEDGPQEIPSQDARPLNTPQKKMQPQELDGMMRIPPSDPSDLGYKMDVMLETLVDENHKTQVLLNKLIGALTDSVVEEKPVASPASAKPARRASRKGKHENAVEGDREAVASVGGAP